MKSSLLRGCKIFKWRSDIAYSDRTFLFRNLLFSGVLAVLHPFLFHSAVLKPDLNLAITQVDPPRNLFPHLAADKLVLHEFAFQFGELVFRVRSTTSSGRRRGPKNIGVRLATRAGVTGVIGMMIVKERHRFRRN